jgi:hypothetical protein
MWVLLGVGLAIRLALAFDTRGSVFDLTSYVLVKDALRHHTLHVYSVVNSGGAYRWPYPSAYFPIVALVAALAKLLGLAFTSLIRVPPMIADLALAWLVQDLLRERGATPRLRVLAVASLALGPLFVPVSGYLGGFDSVAVLPALLALCVWNRRSAADRAVWSGALIGLGTALKTVPFLMVFALLPSCRSRREAALLVVSAVVVPLVALAPFLAADPHGVVHALRWMSIPGVGGISLVGQPDLAQIWLTSPPPQLHLTGLSHALQGHLGQLILALPLLAGFALLLRKRSRSADAASLLWLIVFAFSVNFGPRYAIWGLPFFLVSGYLGRALLAQALLAIPNALLYIGPFTGSTVVYLYVPLMLIAWAGFLVAATGSCWRMGRAPPGGDGHLRVMLPGRPDVIAHGAG